MMSDATRLKTLPMTITGTQSNTAATTKMGSPAELNGRTFARRQASQISATATQMSKTTDHAGSKLIPGIELLSLPHLD